MNKYSIKWSENLEELRSHGVGGRVGVWVAEQGLDARQDGRHVIGRRPAVLRQQSNVEII